MRIVILLVVCCLLLVSAASTRPATTQRRGFKIVGYLPDWRIDQWDSTRAALVTHLMYFSVEPEADGALDRSRVMPQHLAKLAQMKQQAGVRIILSVGGWKRGTEQFAAMSVSDAARARFVAELVAFCSANGFDGADYDWEFPADAAQTDGYSRLLVQTKEAFAPHGMELSIAVNPYQTFTPDAVAALDHIFLMAYDDDGRHGTVEFAQRMVKVYRDQGVPAEKLVLGVPFYGRPIVRTHTSGGNNAYHRILRDHPDLGPDQDEVEGVYFNNLTTIRRKTRLAREQGLAGVGMWEITEDAPGDRSLLSAMADEAAR
jgi:GH18 family chitinase